MKVGCVIFFLHSEKTTRALCENLKLQVRKGRKIKFFLVSAGKRIMWRKAHTTVPVAYCKKMLSISYGQQKCHVSKLKRGFDAAPPR